MKNLAATIRTLSRNPGYSLLVVFTLALGIGSSAAVFSLLDAIYFRPIPIRAPAELVRIHLESSKSTFGTLSYSEYQRISESVPALQDAIAVGRRGVTFRQGDDSLPMIIHYVSGNYFDALGIPMYLGRGLKPSDDTPQATSPTVVINYQLWVDHLARRNDVINSTIRLNDTLFTVVGVTAAGFPGLNRLQRTDVWVTVAQAGFVVPRMQEEVTAPYNRWFEIIGRVKPGAQAGLAAQLQTLLTNWHVGDAERYNGASLTARDYLADDRNDRAQGAVFLALVVLVLLIACSDAANLALARGEAQRRDLALRAALGASRTRLIRDALREAMVLSCAAAVVGLILVLWLMDLFPSLVPPGAGGMLIDTRIDARLFAFMTVLSLLTFLLVGAIPAWRSMRTDVWATIKQEGPGSAAGGRGLAVRDFLVVTQIALSVMVLIAAGMLVRSLDYGRNINPGFDTHKNVASFYIVPGLTGYDNAATYRFFESARNSVASLPGVRRTSYAIRLPAQANESGWADDFTIPGQQPPSGEQFFRIKYTMVGPNYFETMGTRVVAGRGVDETDLPNSRGVVIINETMARRFWPGETPIGKTVMVGRRNPMPREIVGVAEDNKIASLYEDSQMYVYVPFAQNQQGFGLLLVETQGDGKSVVPSVRRKIGEIDSGLRILDTTSIASHMQFVLFDERRDAIVATALSVLSLFLTVVGVYGVVSLVTRRRVREIGIRIALGASRTAVIRLVVGHIWLVAGIGVGLGVGGGAIIGRLFQARLHGVTSFDAPSMLLAAITLFLAATVAGALPSWRAARVDPTQAFRQE